MYRDVVAVERGHRQHLKEKQMGMYGLRRSIDKSHKRINVCSVSSKADWMQERVCAACVVIQCACNFDMHLPELLSPVLVGVNKDSHVVKIAAFLKEPHT